MEPPALGSALTRNYHLANGSTITGTGTGTGQFSPEPEFRSVFNPDLLIWRNLSSLKRRIVYILGQRLPFGRNWKLMNGETFGTWTIPNLASLSFKQFRQELYANHRPYHTPSATTHTLYVNHSTDMSHNSNGLFNINSLKRHDFKLFISRLKLQLIACLKFGEHLKLYSVKALGKV